ncbi:MarR family winged helix-turn-helix transcriptional regulator [Streptomyces cylindrosporus]|uniref:MarR family transcriptional regulator n=1 Tax=Streptomyces cylindrosporus TaxID=2927583 RepID=A0ABS9YNJ7_9ACTN|nr:MarR family transcriptional regulator [Streptomyces cylindrosporus]MCI3278832.1 MarR family transcriptional regulator [Streptomyces cylindrosporus]
MTVYGRLAELDVWLLSGAALRAQRLLCDYLDTTGLRMQHYRVMAGLAELGESTQAELGRALGLDAGNLVVLLGDLEERGAVSRKPDPGNRRRNLVKHTERGRKLYQEMDRAVEQANEVMFAAFTPAEREQFHKVLVRLAQGSE